MANSSRHEYTLRTEVAAEQISKHTLATMIKANVLTNHFLVAMPMLTDFNFSKSVVYLYEHTKEGALGMIINKPSQINLGNVLEHLNISVAQPQIATTPVLMGGPVGQEHGFILFERKTEASQTGIEISVSASKEMLKDIANDQGPEHFLVTLGYSGWDAGQLEEEIARNDWLVVPFDHKILFETPLEKRWELTAALIGIDIKRLSGHVGHA